MAAPRLSVIVPHVGAAAGLAACFAALAGQTEPADEVVVADNNAGGDAAAIRAVAGAAGLAVAVAHVPERGAGPARNGGVAASTGEWLAFVDSDCRPAPDWAAAARRALAARPVSGGQIRIVAADPARPGAVEAFDLVFGFDPPLFLRRAGHLLTPNLLCTRDAFQRVGQFRNGIPEDKEWSHRAAAMGYRLAIASDALVVHPALATWSQLAFRWRRMTREEHALARERRGGLPRFWARSFLVLASIAPHALRLARSPKTSGVRGATIAVLVRSRLDRFLYAQRLMLGRP